MVLSLEILQEGTFNTVSNKGVFSDALILKFMCLRIEGKNPDIYPDVLTLCYVTDCIKCMIAE